MLLDRVTAVSCRQTWLDSLVHLRTLATKNHFLTQWATFALPPFNYGRDASARVGLQSPLVSGACF